MSLSKCDNCGNEFPAEEIENHKLYCIFSIQQKELENLIPCEICNQLIDFSVYQQHLLHCCPVTEFTGSNYPSLNEINTSEDDILSRAHIENRNLLNFINEIDELINRLTGVDSYDNLINLDENNVTVGVKKIEDFVTKKIEKIICPICTTETEEIGETSCGHKFCYECIEEWLKENKKCPICMIEFNDN